MPGYLEQLHNPVSQTIRTRFSDLLDLYADAELEAGLRTMPRADRQRLRRILERSAQPVRET